MAAQFGITIDDTRPRIVMTFDRIQYPAAVEARWPATRRWSTGAALGHPLGKGHVVMFAIRPFWRWQTQGTYTLGFNAIMNWNDLDAGGSAGANRPTQQ